MFFYSGIFVISNVVLLFQNVGFSGIFDVLSSRPVLNKVDIIVNINHALINIFDQDKGYILIIVLSALFYGHYGSYKDIGRLLRHSDITGTCL